MKQPSHLRRLAFSSITVLCLLALLFVALAISVANDLYAFVKPNRAVSFTVEEPTSLKELSAALERQGIIANPTVFRVYVNHQGRTELLENFCGTLTLNSAMSYRQILLAFAA